MKELLFIPLIELLGSAKSLLITVFGSLKMIIFFVITYILSIIAPIQDVFVFACVLVLIDWILAFSYAVRNKCVDSKKRWKLVSKLIAYFIIFFIIGGIMKYASYLSGIVCVFITVILLMEFWSILANLKLLFPNLKFLNSLQEVLEHEINKKKESLKK